MLYTPPTHTGDKQLAISAAVICIVIGLVFGCSYVAGAQPAPDPAPPLPSCQTPSPCKVIILSAEEERALTGDKMILDTALQGRTIDLLGPVLYFRDKLKSAPNGTAKTP